MAVFGAHLKEGKKALQQLRDIGKDPWVVVRDCLRAYEERMLLQIRERTQLAQLPETLDIELLLCVPQVRLNYDVQRKFMAAGKAIGVRSVRLVPEAFAAAAFITAEPSVFGQPTVNGMHY